MDVSASIIWSMLFSTIGLGYFVYGRRQKRGVALLSGVALMAYPYFVSSMLLIIMIGIGLMALPYFIRS
ncbi:MAG: hypothetical protein ACE5HV_02380 [Acidobacteriota bacterium]